MVDNQIKNDHYYAELLELMRAQGKKDNPETIQIGTMLSPTSVRIDDLILNAEDLYIADYLVKGYRRKIEIPYLSDTGGTTQEYITYADGLKAGDLVAIQRVKNNMYVIISRVVRVE